jgi:hypothetical protein
MYIGPLLIEKPFVGCGEPLIGAWRGSLPDNRSDADFQKLIQKLNNGPCSFATDGWPGFNRPLPEERHLIGGGSLHFQSKQLATTTYGVRLPVFIAA